MEVPETPVPVDYCLEDIENSVDPLASSDEYGIDLYLNALDIVLAGCST